MNEAPEDSASTGLWAVVKRHPIIAGHAGRLQQGRGDPGLHTADWGRVSPAPHPRGRRGRRWHRLPDYGDEDDRLTEAHSSGTRPAEFDLSGALARRTSHQTMPPTINGGSALSTAVVHRKA